MLVNFRVENFLSFMDSSSLSLEAGSIREFTKNAFAYKMGTQDIRLLKSVFLSGGNAAGKSNFLKAFLTMKNMVLFSAREQQSISNPIVPFLLNTRTNNSPSTFEVTFLIDRIGYRYGFIADNKKIHFEWLYTIAKRKEENIFTRSGEDIIIDKRFSPDQKQKLNFASSMTREDCLFLSILPQFKIDFVLKIIKWFQDNMIYIENELDIVGENSVSYTAELLKKHEYRELIYYLLDKANLGFTSMEDELQEQISRKPNNSAIINLLNSDPIGKYTIKTKHRVYNANLEPAGEIYFDLLKQESAGSRKFIGMLGLICEAIIEGRVMWIDELDAQLHMELVTLILNFLHNSPQNKNGAQFIITTHSPHILKKLRRDQMIMLDKNEFGVSTIGSVYIKKRFVRGDVIFDKEYLLGNLGGMPKIKQMSLFDDQNE